MLYAAIVFAESILITFVIMGAEDPLTIVAQPLSKFLKTQ